MKAYRVARPAANLFRARDNCQRFQRSAQRIAMTPVPQELFLEGIHAVVGACTQFVPDKSGQSLYVRPFLFGTEPGYAVRASRTARFMVIANPSEAYSAGAMKVLIEREQVRAAAGGLGTVKAGANYAASLLASTRAVEQGYTVALWLDPTTRQNIEELSGMNLFAVIGDELHTPVLNDSILPGVTRDSLIVLARDNGWRVVEKRCRSAPCCSRCRAANAARYSPAARRPSSVRSASSVTPTAASTGRVWSTIALECCGSDCLQFRRGGRQIPTDGPVM